ncbi:DEAD/DEAH box helicase family protein [Chloroflexus aurantiacus]
MKDIIDQLRESRLRAYETLPGDITEHYGIEEVVLAGGYGYRQIFELVQNAADAILEAHETGTLIGDTPRIEVRLTDHELYVANTGAPFSREGIEAILRSHSSPKRGNQIGRFGLGFKSLLRLGGKIDIVSGEAAFGFDPDRCRRELQERFKVTKAPGLRLAWNLAAGRENELREQFPWATTVVCAEIKAANFTSHLQEEIDGFPAEFLLFFPVTVSLSLESNSKPRREIHCAKDAHRAILYDGTATSRWIIVEKLVSISDANAKEDATHIHARDEVPLLWAIPTEGKREEAGRFWAFFPTNTPTFLPGILNAPWKLNSDRNALIRGEWNSCLMQAAAHLVADTLPELYNDADPGCILDAFPRQPERWDDIARPLVSSLWDLIKAAAIIPDGTGKLRKASDLFQYPTPNATIVKQWFALAPETVRRAYIHPSCLERQRLSRLNVLANELSRSVLGTPGLAQVDVARWFAQITTAQTAVDVLRLVESYQKHVSARDWENIREKLAVVLCEDGTFRTSREALFAPQHATMPHGRHRVEPILSDNPETRRILSEILRVQTIDDSVWMNAMTEALLWKTPQTDDQWLSLWRSVYAAPEQVRYEFVSKNRNYLKVRRRDGQWVSPDNVLLPGRLVAEHDQDNQAVLIDSRVFPTDHQLFQLLGLSDFPETYSSDVSRSAFEDKPLQEWLSLSKSHYFQSIRKEPVRYSPYWDSIQPKDLKMPNGWRLLHQLVDEPNVRLTHQLLKFLAKYNNFRSITIYNISGRPGYPSYPFCHFLPWLITFYGRCQIGNTIIPVSSLLSIYKIRDRLPFDKLENGSDLKSMLDTLQEAFQASPEKAPKNAAEQVFYAFIGAIVTSETIEDDSLYNFWDIAADYSVVPKSIPTRRGAIPITQVFTTRDQVLAKIARNRGYTVIALSDNACWTWEEHGAKSLDNQDSPVDVTFSDSDWEPPQPITSVFPELARVLEPSADRNVVCQKVRELQLEIIDTIDSIPCILWNNTLFINNDELDKLSYSELIDLVLAELDKCGWLAYSKAKALEILFDSELERRRAYVAEGSSLAERLLRAVGEKRHVLINALELKPIPSKRFLDNCTAIQLAELVLAYHGPATLSKLRDVLEKEHLQPPHRWNTEEARKFVKSIGFPPEFATASEERRDSEEYISGPIDLPPLHDFQQEILDNIKQLLSITNERRRAVVSLPTGSGKTRVTVEAAVRFVLKPEHERRMVLWIAQTDELCEQAVQAFRQVWINCGATNTDLRIIRLWGGNPNPIIQETNQPVVVVASIQTLNARIDRPELSWLQKSGLVVIDECHHAITPSYTRLLRFLKIDTPHSNGIVEPPIIGLSATPFRTDDEESKWLARRFDQRWFPSNQEELYIRLRRQGILAEVNHELLESGIPLTEEEIDALARLSELWEAGIIERINTRLADVEPRNQKIIDRILQASEQSIMLFANSVDHAREMALRLNLSGVPAAVVSSDTPTVSRRYFLEQFKRGEIRVLCNHTLLSTGFDAPKVDMILISRVVFSPVRYMQMVGRGLRGEKNGGKATCRIVTVLDNLLRFQSRHPYHYCQELFTNYLRGSQQEASMYH